MPTIHLRFPGGRYHATPGGHHVNEGQIEWPPSPWRLLRALIATGYATQDWTSIPGEGVRLLQALAGVLPTYHLPAASAAHTRHYMPMAVLDKGREKTTMVFDTWAQVGDGVLGITWPVVLDATSTALLNTLVTSMGYLGRSESWIEGQLATSDAAPVGTKPAFPCAGRPHPGPGWQQIPLTAAETPEDFANWREPLILAALNEVPLLEGNKKAGKKLLEDRAKAIAPFPSDLLDALQWDTARWKGHRWGQPPGSRAVLYWCRSDALEIGPPAIVQHARVPPVSAMLLALATPSRNDSALPTIARALPQAELLHQSLVSQAGGGGWVDCPEFTGQDAYGQRLTGHRHAYLLPIDLDGDGRLDHILIHVKSGMGEVAQRAVQGLRRTWQKGGTDLNISLAGSGELDALRQLPESLHSGVERLLGARGGSRTWISQSPFVPPRFLKAAGRNCLVGQVQAELASHGHSTAEVELLPWDDQTLALRHAVRIRRGRASSPPVDCGFAIRLTFSDPVTGPICLGYGSHFGLGLFQAQA
jgi:CRISPR-associated protein Csb2